MLASGPARAQAAPDPETDAATSDLPGEIVITAQKRSELLQDVPSSISVVQGDDLTARGATSIADYAGYIPGFNVTSAAPGRNQYTLRGITTGVSDSSTVGTYIDDAPFGSSTANAAGGLLGLDLLPYDIQRVEVLRGPQGTLYGASTMGGLLKYVTRTPDLDEFEADVGGEVSDFAHSGELGWTARAAISVPLVEDRLAIRASLFKHHDAGYIDNAATGEEDVNSSDQYGGRISLRWAATESVEVRLTALRQTIDVEGNPNIAVRRATREPTFGDFITFNILPVTSKQKIGFYTAAVDWDLGGVDLVSVSSYSTMDLDGVSDASPGLGAIFGGAHVGVSTFVELEKFSQELRLASPTGGTFEWLVGGFFTKEESSFGQTGTATNAAGISLPGVNPVIDAALPSDYDEFSLFVNATYRLSDSFDITGGVRYSHAEQSFTTTTTGFLFNRANPSAVVRNGGDSSEDVVTYLFSPRVHLGPDTMIYGRIASGYRPGGPNVSLPGTPSEFDADKLINYEIGIKSQFLDSKASIELALFYIDWTNIQIQLSTGNIGFRTNAGDAVSKGVEVSLNFAPFRGFDIGLNGAYTDAKLADDQPSLFAVKGDRVPYAPRWTGSAAVNYEFDLTDSVSAQFGGGYRYIGNRNSLFPRHPINFRFDSYGALDLYAGLTYRNYTLRLFAKNATDEYAFIAAGGSAGPGQVQIGVARPRIAGLSLDARF